MINFGFLKKCDFALYSKKLFDILADNMSVICPTGNSREDDYREWFSAVSDGLKKENRNIILIYNSENSDPIGFFQYYTTHDTFMMEEIQIMSEYMGKFSIFRDLYGFVLQNISLSIKYVEAYANRQNKKSIGILKRLGLDIIEKVHDGRLYHFKGKFSDLVKWYEKR